MSKEKARRDKKQHFSPEKGNKIINCVLDDSSSERQDNSYTLENDAETRYPRVEQGIEIRTETNIYERDETKTVTKTYDGDKWRKEALAKQGDDSDESETISGITSTQKRQIEEICENICGQRQSQKPIQDITDLENAHSADLDLLEQAIAEKRLQITAQIEMDHMKEKAALEAKIEKLEHARLTQQHNFRSASYKMQQRLENLNRQHERELEEHEKDLQRVAMQEKTLTQNVLNKIAAVRAQRERLAPELGRLDGALQVALSPEEEKDPAHIERGILADINRKLQNAIQNNATEEQQLESMASQELDSLMDEINNLDQELEEERRLTEEAKTSHTSRLNDLRAEIAGGRREPLNIEDEKQKLQDEVNGMKEYWRSLRGNIEEELKCTMEATEKVKEEGQTKLMKQKADFFLQRQDMAECIKEVTEKICEEEIEIETAKQAFEDCVRIKTKEMHDQEDKHREALRELTDSRDKRLKELELKENETATKRGLEIGLLENKKENLIESFNVKKSHILETIKEAEERIKDIQEELCSPTTKENESIAKLETSLLEVKQSLTCLVEEKDLVQNISKREIEAIQTEGQILKQTYSNQLKAKQTELMKLKQVEEKQARKIEAKLAAAEQKYSTDVEKLTEENEKLRKYIDNLTAEVDRLQTERVLLQQEYEAINTGLQDVTVRDEQHIECEREKVHEEMQVERGEHEKALDEVNRKISDARAARHQMTTQFKKDVNEFASRAVASGLTGLTPTDNKPTILNLYQEQIQEYIKRVQTTGDKLAKLANTIKDNRMAKAKQKKKSVLELHKKNTALEKELKNKENVIKNGNNLLQFFSNEDHCLYCKDQTPSNVQRNQLENICKENKNLSKKLDELHKREKEYDKVAIKQLEELKSTLEKSKKSKGKKESLLNAKDVSKQEKAKHKTDSQSSKDSITSKTSN